MFRSDVKKRQKESLIARTLTPILHETFRDNPLLTRFSVSRVELSRDGGLCTVFIQSLASAAEVEIGMQEIKLFAPATRKALASVLQTKFVPELRFAYDEHIEKINRLNEVLERVSYSLKTIDQESSSDEETKN